MSELALVLPGTGVELDGRGGPMQLLDPLTPEQYAALKSDIQARGVRIPIVVDADTGAVIDGHHRRRICQELGIEVPTVARRYASDAERWQDALVLNLLRRHLGPVAWANAFTALAAARGVTLGNGKGDPSGKAATVAALAKETGVKPRTARHRLQLARDLAGHPDLVRAVDDGEMAANYARRVTRERAAADCHRAPELPADADLGADLRAGDFREVLDDLAPGSVAMVFTDPPYAEEYLPLYGDLAALSARLLAPGGLLLCYCGKSHFWEVGDHLRRHLRHVWIASLMLPGSNARIRSLCCWTGWRPILMFSNGPFRPRRWFEDVYRSERREKELHDWQQSPGVARYLIERFTAPGDLVVDPFLGSGTTAIAARDLGRRFVGCDVDPDRVTAARHRLATTPIVVTVEEAALPESGEGPRPRRAETFS